MLGTQELIRIKQQEQAAFERKQMAWEAYAETRKRFDNAYYLMLWTWDDFVSVKEEPQSGHRTEIALAIAEKRHHSAREEFNYQRLERERMRVEFEAARIEYRKWRKEHLQKLADINAVNANEGEYEVVAN